VPAPATRVAAFGDSVMWGQGLNRQDRFTARIAALLPALAPPLGQQPAMIVADASRSGSQIRARADQRTAFVDTFPALFDNGRARSRFLDGTDERPATGLYGENPAAFPTVRGQVNLLTNAEGKAVDVALVDGGVNDIDVEDVVNPAIAPGEFVERWDGDIRRVGHDDVLELLLRVRRKCPNAVILYFGFFAPLSYASSVDKLRDLFEYETDDAIGWFLNGIFGCEDVNAAILAAQTRGTWLQGRWQYWTRRAVDDANSDDATRGPGVLFVPSGFGADNAAFAPGPFLFEDYRAPTTDAARPQREQRIPRIQHLKAMQDLYDGALQWPSPGMPVAEVRRLEAALDGPSSLKRALRAYATEQTIAGLVQCWELLRVDILRMRHALIASAGHPDEQGAQSYADNAIRRIREHAEAVTRANREQRPGQAPSHAGAPPPKTLDSILQRYKLRSSGSLLGDVGHLDVDSLAVRVVTRADSDQNFFPDLWLVVSTVDAAGKKERHQYQLNFTYRVISVGPAGKWVIKPYPHLEPGATNRFTVAPAERLRLEEIVGCALVVGGDRLAGLTTLKAYGKTWRPDAVRLEVNGRSVAEQPGAGRKLGFLASMDLSYPEPQPNFVPPKLAPVAVKSVKKLPPRVNARRARAAVELLARDRHR
jgi:hypothetical protein